MYVSALEFSVNATTILINWGEFFMGVFDKLLDVMRLDGDDDYDEFDEYYDED